MPLTVEQFTQRLTSSGVMSEDELRDWIAAVPVEKRPGDGDALARELVRVKKLTKFQAEQLYAGKGSSLTLGNYVILDKLGQGGMGMVLKAQHKRMARVVALKVMSPAAVKSKDAVKRFHREVQTAAKLTHPNIVTAFDADEAKGTHFLVMEYVEGDDLSQLVKKHGVMSVEQAIECMIQAARGLTHAHAERVIHRDIKPANLLLDKHGTVKILDMGLARLEGGLSDAAGVEGAGLTQSGAIMGTVDYMSPEQAEDTRHADARADIYSLGCSLYYLLTGHAVYGGETMMKKLLAHREAPLPPLSNVLASGGRQPPGALDYGVTNTPGGLRPPLAELQIVFHKMIAKRPNDRYQSMGEVIADLERCRAGQSVTVNVNAVSGESGSNYELQKFLRQISGEEGSQVTSATSGPLGMGGPVDGTVETVFTTNNSAGTDPQTEMTIAGERSRRAGGGKTKSRNVLLASVSVVLLLIGGWWLVRTPRGAVRIEITDEQIEVTVGETGRTLRGVSDETVRIPVGEHVLHVLVGETQLDTPEITVAKGEPGAFKVERVGNRVRVMRDGKFLVAKELPKSKASGAKNTANAGTSSDAVQNYALEFDGKASHVEIPTLERHQSEPLTLEAWVRSAKPAGVLVRMEGRAAAQIHVATYNDALAGGELGSPQDLHRYLNAGSKLSAEIMTHVAYVIDERGAKLFLNGVHVQTLRGKFATPNSQTPFRGTWLGAQPNNQGGSSYLFQGVLDEVRISKVARYDKDFRPDVRFTPDKDTLALYHFDEGQGDVLKDSSGNKHYGKIVGAKWVKVEPPPPPANYALEFDGKSSHVEIPALASRNFGTLTVEAWVNADQASRGHKPIIAMQGPYWVQLNRGPGNWYAIDRDAISFHNEATPAGRWCHLAFVLDEKMGQFFVDGHRITNGLRADATVKHASQPSGGIGATKDPKLPDFLHVFNGMIDEVRISKVARYDKDFTPDVRFTSDKDTLALYHFDEGTGSELKDSSGNNHHGKIVGAKWVAANLKSEISNFKSQSSDPLSPYDILTSPDYEWTAPENLGPVVNSSHSEGSPCLSADGLTLLFETHRPGGQDSYDLWGCRRPTLSAPWSAPENLGLNVNSKSFDTNPSLSADGLTLIFSSDRDNPAGLWVCTRATLADPWSPAKKLASSLDTPGANDGGPEQSTDGLSLLFHSWGRPGNQGGNDLWQRRRPNKADPWGKPENLGPTLNSDWEDVDSALSSDGRVLLFSSPRSNGKTSELWWCSRSSFDPRWSVPQPIGPPVYLMTDDTGPTLSADGQTMIFASADRKGGLGGSDLWMTRRVRKQTPVNLLPLIDPAKDAVHGGWSINPAGELMVDQGTPARIRIPFRPAAEYDLHIEFTRTSGNESNVQVLVAGGHQFLLALGSHKNTYVYFSYFDGQFAGTVQKEAWLVNGQRYRSLVQVRKGGVKAFLDGVLVTELTTDYSTAASPKEWEIGDPAVLGVGENSSLTTYHRIELVEITGHGTFTRPADAAAKAAEAKRTATSDKFTNSLGMEFVRVPKGKSWLGGGGGKPGTQEVTISEDFYLGKFEVTQEEWQKVMGSVPSYFSRIGGGKVSVQNITDAELKRFPMEAVSWDQCQELIKLLNEKAKESGWVYRLPTATEWEYACRGGPMDDQAASGFDYYFREPTLQLLPEQANFQPSDKTKFLERPRKAGSYLPNRLGLYDMHGNVSEWCGDVVVDAKGVSQRVHCGGAWFKHPDLCRAASRDVSPPSPGLANIGFRLARVPTPNFTNSLGMEFVRVPKGKSWLGGGGGKPGTQEVTISEDFFLGKYEVTQDEWEKVMGSRPSQFTTAAGVPQKDQKRFPVEKVSWEDCQKFIAKLNEPAQDAGWEYRLPTTSEWEYACRGGPLAKPEDSAFHFYFDQPTNTFAPDKANVIETGLRRPCPVGSYSPNRLGLHDLHGNVREWCADARTGRDGSALRVFRYGGWSTSAVDCWADKSDGIPPSSKDHDLGLRVARVKVATAFSTAFTNALGMEFVRVPKGKSCLGGGGGRPGTQVVTIPDDFYLGTYEVTQAEYEKVMDGDKPCFFRRGAQGGPSVKDVSDADLKRFPVEAISWDEAQEFLRRLNDKAKDTGWLYRLPMSEEWEYACRGGPMAEQAESAFDFYFETPTQRLQIDQANYQTLDKSKYLERPCKVGAYRPNRLGLYDMHGNVAEWCADPAVDDKGLPQRVHRGGHWFNLDGQCAAALRQINPPALGRAYLGLRLARVPVVAKSSSFVPLFNGKDLTGLKQRAANGIAEVVVEDGQPILKLQNGSNLTTRPFGDYHLRLEFRAEKGSKVRPYSDSVSAQLMVELGDDLTKARVNGTELTHEAATIQAGRFVGNGQTLNSKQYPYPDPRGYLLFTNVTLNPNSPWQRLEIIRLGDSCAVLLNGKLTAATTNLRIARAGEPPKAPGPTEIGLTAYGGTASYRNIEIREITSLPVID